MLRSAADSPTSKTCMPCCGWEPASRPRRCVGNWASLSRLASVGSGGVAGKWEAELRCLCDVEVENLRRERLVADVTLDKLLLQEELRRPGEVCPGAGRGSVFSGWKSVQRETG